MPSPISSSSSAARCPASTATACVRSPFMRKMFGPVLYDAFREIKRTFDPHGILNPGKIVDAPPLTSNLRYGPAYRSRAPQTWFDYSAWGGMSGAVEMCSGLGACRKTLDGTMCPSYMATREEAHSTRGRANTLRLVMAGRLDESGLGDEGVREVLDLCLECRACKAECPVGVDVARFKSEFLADYWKRHGTPLRARALGHVHDLSVWASRMPGVANALIGSGPVRALNARLLGLHPDRALPRWASRTLAGTVVRQRTQWLPLKAELQATVVLFNDTFTNYFHPEIGLAARRRAAGDGRVRWPGGERLLRPAADLAGAAERGARAGRAEHAVSAASLARRPDRPPTLVFLEPSCLSAMREDVPALLRGEEQQQALRVAERCVSFEEFLEQRAAGRPASTARERPGAHPAPRPLPSEVDGRTASREGAAGADPWNAGHRSRCRLLRDGGIVRLRAGALRGLAPDRRAPAAAGRAQR